MKNNYADKLESLIAKLNKELAAEKEAVAAKGADAVFEYAAEYVQKCDIISSLEDVLDMADPDIDPDIPIENIEFLLSGTPFTAFGEIEKRFGWYMDDYMWSEYRSSVIYAIEQAFRDAGLSHDPAQPEDCR